MGVSCEADDFWDDAMDRCQSCADYCQDFLVRGTEAVCRELCPDFVQRQLRGDRAASSSSLSQTVPGWVVALVLALALVAALVGVGGVVTLRRRRRSAGVGRGAGAAARVSDCEGGDACFGHFRRLCGAETVTSPAAIAAIAASEENGKDKLLTGGDNISVDMQVGEDDTATATASGCQGDASVPLRPGSEDSISETVMKHHVY